MVRIILGLILGLLIGSGCSRYFDIPLPAPSKFIGALVILSITLSYISTDYLLNGPMNTAGSIARPARRPL